MHPLLRLTELTELSSCYFRSHYTTTTLSNHLIYISFLFNFRRNVFRFLSIFLLFPGIRVVLQLSIFLLANVFFFVLDVFCRFWFANDKVAAAAAADASFFLLYTTFAIFIPSMPPFFSYQFAYAHHFEWYNWIATYWPNLRTNTNSLINSNFESAKWKRCARFFPPIRFSFNGLLDHKSFHAYEYESFNCSKSFVDCNLPIERQRYERCALAFA